MAWLERHRGNLAVVLLVLVAVAAFAVLQMPRRSALQVVTSSPPTPIPMKVHVTGAVSSPGVYQLPADARIDDALKAAGGPSAAADVGSLNLAAPLKDGQQVVIPSAGEPEAAANPAATAVTVAATSYQPASATKPAASPGKTNLNTATRQELEALPGIGVALAGRILEYRAAHGGFTSIEELKDAKILNSSTFDKVKDLVEVR